MQELFITDTADAFNSLGDKYIIRSHLDNYYYLEQRDGFVKKLIRLEEKSWLVYKGDWSISKEELNGIWQCINSIGHSIEYVPTGSIERKKERVLRLQLVIDGKWSALIILRKE